MSPLRALTLVWALAGSFVTVAPLVPSTGQRPEGTPGGVEQRLEQAFGLERSGGLDRARTAYSAVIADFPDDPRGYLRRAWVRLRLLDATGAVGDYDRVAHLAPEYEPHLWQRGIAHYYAGQFEACTAQFEMHRTVNPDDVENAVWHFLCAARRSDIAGARAGLLPVGHDRRAPMPQIYEMFAGRMSPSEVHDVVSSDAGRFYADLYVGLYLEAIGDPDGARGHLQAAAGADTGGAMRDVARIHLGSSTASGVRQR